MNEEIMEQIEEMDGMEVELTEDYRGLTAKETVCIMAVTGVAIYGICKCGFYLVGKSKELLEKRKNKKLQEKQEEIVVEVE